MLQPGILTTVQDLGRFGHQREGVPVSGAMDPFAHRVANALVGNDDGDATLEITMAGPTLVFDEDTLVALAGADLGATIGRQPIAPWRALRIRSGTTFSFGAPASGCRAYLAVAGGIDVPSVLGSRSTYIRAGIGGHLGRALLRDDVIHCGAPSPLASRIAATLDAVRGQHGGVAIARWGAGPTLRPRYSTEPSVRLLPGTHLDALTPASQDKLFRSDFRVSPRSDRMGYRLEGPPLDLTTPIELLSEAVTFGTVQLPPGGNPIVLMADRQTTGGYPRIGEVASIDLPLLAQLKSGDRVTFRPVSLGEAQTLYLGREQEVAEARRAIALRHP